MIKYNDMYLKKQNAQYARILNVSDVVGSIRSLWSIFEKNWWELEHFNKHFLENTRKRGPAGKCFGFFFLDIHYYILNGKFNPKIGTIRAFLSKSELFFSIQKGKRRPPLRGHRVSRKHLEVN